MPQYTKICPCLHLRKLRYLDIACHLLQLFSVDRSAAKPRLHCMLHENLERDSKVPWSEHFETGVPLGAVCRSHHMPSAGHSRIRLDSNTVGTVKTHSSRNFNWKPLSGHCGKGKTERSHKERHQQHQPMRESPEVATTTAGYHVVQTCKRSDPLRRITTMVAYLR